MDKFVVRKKRELHASSSKLLKPKQLTQSTLQSLAGVVVIEDLEQAKHCLESESESLDNKIRVLDSLLAKKPSKEVLIKVGIGKTVNKLRKLKTGEDKQCSQTRKLRKLSEKVYRKWKTELERKVDLQSKPVDVKCDKVKVVIEYQVKSKLGYITFNLVQ